MPDQSMNFKSINYRGGIVRFEIPSEWMEEYEEEGGGAFYKAGQNTGTLRLNIIDFKKTNPERDTDFDSIGYEWLRDGLYLKKEQKRFTENGSNCILLSWQVGYDVEQDHYRIAAFNYTVEEEYFNSPQTEAELAVIKSILRNAEFGKALGSLL